jgi:hypothetical protein
MKLPPSPEVRVQMLLELYPHWTRQQAERFVANTPHTHLPHDSDSTNDDL